MTSNKKIWTVYFTAGLYRPARVYGVDENEARRNAIAQFRYAQGAVDTRSMDQILDRIEPAEDNRGMYGSRMVSEFDTKSIFDRRA